LFRRQRSPRQARGVRSRLTDASEKPTGTLRITTTVGLGSTWLTDRITNSSTSHPTINLQLILDDGSSISGLREADVAIRLRRRVQPDLIQRRPCCTVQHAHLRPR